MMGRNQVSDRKGVFLSGSSKRYPCARLVSGIIYRHVSPSASKDRTSENKVQVPALVPWISLLSMLRLIRLWSVCPGL